MGRGTAPKKKKKPKDKKKAGKQDGTLGGPELKQDSLSTLVLVWLCLVSFCQKMANNGRRWQPARLVRCQTETISLELSARGRRMKGTGQLRVGGEVLSVLSSGKRLP